MMSYTYILIALAIAGQVRAAEEEAAGAAEPYAYGYEAPDHSAAEERKPDGTVSGYYSLKDADGRSRRVNYVADESGFHASVETNEHGTKTSNPADARILAAPASPEQLVYQQQVQYQQPPQPQQLQQSQQAFYQQFNAQPQKLLNQQVQYGYQNQPDFNHEELLKPFGSGNNYAYGAYPSNSVYGAYSSNSAYGAYPSHTAHEAYPSKAAHGYAHHPGSNGGYHTQTSGSAYYPSSAYGAYNTGYASSHASPVSHQSLLASSYGVGDNSVHGTYNHHTPASYFSAVRESSQQVVGKPVASGANYVTSSQVVPASQSSVYRTVSSSSSTSNSASSPVGGSSNYSIIQKREVEAPKAAQPSQQEKASPEKPGQEKKTN